MYFTINSVVMISTVSPKEALPFSHGHLARLPDTTFYQHPSYTTLFEKAAFFGMAQTAVMKTLYYDDGEGTSLCGIVCPAPLRIPSADLRAYTGLKRPRMATTLPEGMAQGTCGPFLTDRDLLSLLVASITVLAPTHDMVDFAIPSRPNYSMHTRQDTLYQYLEKRFGNLCALTVLSAPRHATSTDHALKENYAESRL